MKVYGKKPNTLCGQHVNASHHGTQALHTLLGAREATWLLELIAR